jgi:hypothetical protein
MTNASPTGVRPDVQILGLAGLASQSRVLGDDPIIQLLTVISSA